MLMLVRITTRMSLPQSSERKRASISDPPHHWHQEVEQYYVWFGALYDVQTFSPIRGDNHFKSVAFELILIQKSQIAIIFDYDCFDFMYHLV